MKAVSEMIDIQNKSTGKVNKLLAQQSQSYARCATLWTEYLIDLTSLDLSDPNKVVIPDKPVL
jgi:hypothetical protein